MTSAQRANLHASGTLARGQESTAQSEAACDAHSCHSRVLCYKNIAATCSADYRVDATSVAAALWLMMLLLVIEFFQAVCDFLNFFF